MTFTPKRRQRRRRTLIVVLVVVSALLATAYAVTRAQSDQQLRREYLDLAFSVADAHEDAATRFSDMVVRLDELSRPAVVGLLEELEEVVTEESRRLEDAQPPSGQRREQAPGQPPGPGPAPRGVVGR